MPATTDIAARFVRWLQRDEDLDPELWESYVLHDVATVAHVIAVTATIAFLFNLRVGVASGELPMGFVVAKVVVVGTISSSLVWMPAALRKWGNGAPAALFWGGVTLVSATLDRSIGRDLVDMMWALIPGYLAISAVGFSVRALRTVAWLALFSLPAMALVWDHPVGPRCKLAWWAWSWRWPDTCRSSTAALSGIDGRTRRWKKRACAIWPGFCPIRSSMRWKMRVISTR